MHPPPFTTPSWPNYEILNIFVFRKRCQLPVWDYQEKFLDLLARHQNICLVGETGENIENIQGLKGPGKEQRTVCCKFIQIIFQWKQFQVLY